MDASPQTLEELFDALGRSRKLSERLRVLGHAWPLLRSLSPRQREQVGLRVGSRWAWKRLEKAFLSDGELNDNERLIGRIFERMGDSDPKELRKLAAAVRGGDHEDVKDMLMIELREALEDEAEDVEEYSVAEVDLEPEPGVEEEASLAPEPPPIAVAAPVIDGVDDVLASSRATVVEAVGLPPAVDPHIAAPPTPHSPEPPTVAQVAKPQPSAPALAGAAMEPRDIEAIEGFQRMEALRSLRAPPLSGAGLDVAGRARMVASLGHGWASRRALSQMIAARSIDSLEEALSLIGGLSRSGQRLWCLGDLVEHWDLSEGDLEQVLAATPSAASRRRLAGRVARRA